MFHHTRALLKRYWPVLVLIGIGVIVLAPQRQALRSALESLQNAYLPYLLFAIGCIATTYLTSAMVYVLITASRVRFVQTLYVQLAAGFLGRLAPAGSGTIATNVRFLMKQGYTGAQAAGLSIANNLLGFVASAIVVLFAVAFGADTSSVRAPDGDLAWRIGLIVGAGCVIVALAAAYMLRGHIRSTMRQLSATRVSATRATGGLLMSVCTTAGYVFALQLVALALNVHVSFVTLLIVFYAGVLAATITPTPGGFGGAEAALAASLVAVNVPAHQAVAVAISYRLVTYWLPIFVGVIGLRLAQKRRLL